MEETIVVEDQAVAKPETLQIEKAIEEISNRKKIVAQNNKTAIQSNIQKKIMEELNKEKSTKKTEAKKQDTKSSRKRLAKIDTSKSQASTTYSSKLKNDLSGSDSKKKEKKRQQKSKNKRNTSASVKSNTSTPSKRGTPTKNKRAKHDDDVHSNHSYSLRSRGRAEPLSPINEIISNEDSSDKIVLNDSPEVRVIKKKSKIPSGDGYATLGNFIPLSPLTPEFFNKKKKVTNNREKKNNKPKNLENDQRITRSKSKQRLADASIATKNAEILKIDIFEEVVEPESRLTRILNGIKTYGKTIAAGVLSLGLIGLFSRSILH